MMRRWKRWGWHQRVAWLVLAGFLVVCVDGFYVEPARLVERDYTLPLVNWPASCDGLRVDVISDTHTGSPRNGLDKIDRIVAKLSASDADLVVMTGDYVILSVLAGTYIPADKIAEHLKPLTARKPVYAVLGNHDWWKNGPRVSHAFAGIGVHMIDNMALPIDAGRCHFWLAGLGDSMEGHPDVRATFAMIPRQASVITITHEPSLWPRVPMQATLTIAGHTHGGQINPFGWLTPAQFKPYSHQLQGKYVFDGRSLFVSPGIGTSILPMRLGVPPEISRLTLHSKH
ncbi:MAG: metallophosphoesterase [Thermomonas sp.]